MYAVAGFIYDEQNNKIDEAEVTVCFINRKSGSASSKQKEYPIFSDESGYFSFNLADADFLTTDGKIQSGDEILIAINKQINSLFFYARTIHVIDIKNEYNTLNLKLVENEYPQLDFSIDDTGITGEEMKFIGKAFKTQNNFNVTVNGEVVVESQKRNYDIFSVFPNNKIIDITIDWGDGSINSELTHTYDSSGIFTITITATDGYNYISQQQFEVTQFFEVVTRNSCDTLKIFNEEVVFTSENSGHISQVKKTEWYINGVKVGEGDTLPYTFKNHGEFKVKNVVTYNNGFEYVETFMEKDYKIWKLESVAELNWLPKKPFNEDVSFNSLYDIKISGITDKTLVVKDEYIELENQIKNINDARRASYYGSFPIVLKYTFFNGWEWEEGSLTKTITFYKKVAINYDFNWVPNSPTIKDDIILDFYNKDKFVDSFEFTPGTNFSGEQKGDFKFKLSKSSDVILSVDFFNDWDIDKYYFEKKIELENIPPVAKFTIEENQSLANKIVLTSNSFDIDGNVVQYDWEVYNETKDIKLFKKTTTKDEPVVWDCFVEGNYIVCLRIEDDFGATGYAEEMIKVSFEECNTGVPTIKIKEVLIPYIGLNAEYKEHKNNATSLQQDIKVEISVEDFDSIVSN